MVRWTRPQPRGHHHPRLCPFAGRWHAPVLLLAEGTAMPFGRPKCGGTVDRHPWFLQAPVAPRRWFSLYGCRRRFHATLTARSFLLAPARDRRAPGWSSEMSAGPGAHPFVIG